MKILLPDGASSSPDAIFDILAKYKTIAVVGLSSNPARPSPGVSEYMQSSGYQIIPGNPNEKDVLGEPRYARPENAPQKIENVDIFRRPHPVPPGVGAAIPVGAQGVWMRLGVVNEA